MASPSNGVAAVVAAVGRAMRLAVAGLLVGLFAAPSAPAPAAEPALSEADTTCLGCHGTAGLAKDLGGGNTLSLHVAGDGFARSVHRALGCAGCHSDIDVAKHSQGGKQIKDARDYAVTMTAVCRQCHDEAFKQYQNSNHARLQRAGNKAAPVCTDCHGSHAVTPKTAYETCVRCHAAANELHRKWLPNAALHTEVVSCAACHAPAVQRMVELRLYDSAKQRWVTQNGGVTKFQELAKGFDKDANGLDAAELRGLMGEINRDANPASMILRGRIELRNAGEAHRLASKSEALRICDNCHREGAEPFQNVAVSIVGADGRPMRHPAQSAVLTSALSTESLRQFYAIGGTRSKLLDALLVAAVLGGVAVPVVHHSMKAILRRRADDEEASSRALAAAAEADPGAAEGNPPERDARPK